MPSKRPTIDISDSSSDESTPKKRSKPLASREIIDVSDTAQPIPPAKVAPVMTPSVFNIRVSLDSRYRIFPSKICERLEAQYHRAITYQMTHLRNGTAHNFTSGYSIIHASCLRPFKSDFTFTTIAPDLTCRSTANTTLLDIFLANSRSKIRTNGAGMSNFVLLASQEGMENPEFVQLHSVRYGEIGYGFDCNGCLSLYTVEIVEKKHRIEALFVERVKVKVEEE